MRCYFCEREMERHEVQYQLCTGWVKVRAAGGVNQLRLRIATQHFACKSCIDLKDGGHDPRQQQAMF